MRIGAVFNKVSDKLKGINGMTNAINNFKLNLIKLLHYNLKLNF